MAELKDEAETVQQPESAPLEKKRKKWPIVVGIVVVVLVCAGAGFMAWHQQPSFCNAVCHSPMDNYVNSFYDDNSNTMANLHKQAGNNCLDCHETNINEQASEAFAWMGGNFKTDASGNIVGAVSSSADQKFCLRSGCHNQADIVAATQNWGGQAGVNPHDSHLGTVQCSNCHSSHGTSNLMCNSCHDWQVPEGWNNPAA